ncbi:hypothetical protein PIB30_060509, partial [Stylosanthes scabra]|nr:hypothetical protein [Stylosanthes scabra]
MRNLPLVFSSTFFRQKSLVGGVDDPQFSSELNNVHPYKASYKDFKRFFVKVMSVEGSFPFFLDENLSERIAFFLDDRSQ